MMVAFILYGYSCLFNDILIILFSHSNRHTYCCHTCFFSFLKLAFFFSPVYIHSYISLFTENKIYHCYQRDISFMYLICYYQVKQIVFTKLKTRDGQSGPGTEIFFDQDQHQNFFLTGPGPKCFFWTGTVTKIFLTGTGTKICF